MQITWRMDNSGVRECGRSSVWLRLPHLPFLRRGCSAGSAPEWEDPHESGRCRRTIATIAASARGRSRDIAGFPLSPSGASCNGPRRVSIADANSGGRNKKNLIAAVVSSGSNVARHPVRIVGLAVASLALLLMLFRRGLDVTMMIRSCLPPC
jgi:hypothetical protein